MKYKDIAAKGPLFKIDESEESTTKNKIKFIANDSSERPQSAFFQSKSK